MMGGFFCATGFAPGCTAAAGARGAAGKIAAIETQIETAKAGPRKGVRSPKRKVEGSCGQGPLASPFPLPPPSGPDPGSEGGDHLCPLCFGLCSVNSVRVFRCVCVGVAKLWKLYSELCVVCFMFLLYW